MWQFTWQTRINGGYGSNCCTYKSPPERPVAGGVGPATINMDKTQINLRFLPAQTTTCSQSTEEDILSVIMFLANPRFDNLMA